MEKVYEKRRKKAASEYTESVLEARHAGIDSFDRNDCNIHWAFQSGADWEHERAKVLVDALRYYALGAKYCAEPNLKIAQDALKKYGNK